MIQKNSKIVELTKNELVEISGGNPIIIAIVGSASAIATLYEFGYNYAKRHLENAKKTR